MQRMRLMLLAVAASVPAASTTAQGASDYVVVAAHIDNVQHPSTIFQGASDCTNNSFCAAALTMISSATGVPVDKAVAVAAALSEARDGEGGNAMIALPGGYEYCSAQFNLTSIVPRDGDRGSTLLLEARDENGQSGVFMETWTPVQPMFGGRSWVEGDVTAVGVRSDLASGAYAAGTCHDVTGRRAFFVCRGSGCEGAMVDVGHTVATSPTGAGERRT